MSFIQKSIQVAVVVTFLQSCDALFYTNSKENDYPRIGKRPLFKNLKQLLDGQRNNEMFGNHQSKRDDIKKLRDDLDTEDYRMLTPLLVEYMQLVQATHRNDHSDIYGTYEDEGKPDIPEQQAGDGIINTWSEYLSSKGSKCC